MKSRLVLTFVLQILVTSTASSIQAQLAPNEIAPATSGIERAWHLGRVTGDLERIIHFYHDLLGLEFRGDRAQPIPFYSVASINEFVGSPSHAEFRAAFMPIPGTSNHTDPQQQIYLEAFEYRNIDRNQRIPALSDPGVSSLRFFVRDLDAIVASLKAEGTSFITPSGEPVTVAAQYGGDGRFRSIMLRDPDGYPVELVEAPSAMATLASDDSRILGAQMSVVVEDVDAAHAFYQKLLGEGLRTSAPGDWSNGEGLIRVRNLAPAEHRSALIQLPGSSIALELIEFRGLQQTPYRPAFQDIGFGHIALVAADIEVTLGKMQQLGMGVLSESGTWTQINPGLRAVYTRDDDGFFIEIIDNL